MIDYTIVFAAAGGTLQPGQTNFEPSDGLYSKKSRSIVTSLVPLVETLTVLQ